jgi:hypothetical protein
MVLEINSDDDKKRRLEEAEGSLLLGVDLKIDASGNATSCPTVRPDLLVRSRRQMRGS